MLVRNLRCISGFIFDWGSSTVALDTLTGSDLSVGPLGMSIQQWLAGIFADYEKLQSSWDIYVLWVKFIIDTALLSAFHDKSCWADALHEADVNSQHHW